MRRFLPIILWFLCGLECMAAKTKVACIGDSLGYPYQLQEYLGNGYEVRDFGIDGATLLCQGDCPYMSTGEYMESLQYLPDIVLIMLGGNDLKDISQQDAKVAGKELAETECFKDQCVELVSSYRRLTSRPRVIMLTPFRIYSDDVQNARETVIVNDIIPAFYETARVCKAEVVDIHDVFGGVWQEHLLPDKIHPSSIGTGMIAEAICRYLEPKRLKNPCVLPVPGTEYRSAAGWKNGSDWHDVAEDIVLTLDGKSLELLLLGDSITQGFGGNRKLVTTRKGKGAMDEALGENKWEAAGISGDRTQNLLWRIINSRYERCNPKVVLITIGINNVLAGDNPKDIARGVIACAREVKDRMPESRVVVLGPLPAGLEPDGARRKACEEIHAYLAKHRVRNTEYVNPTSWFINPDGSMKTDLYSRDCLHLSRQGYYVWSNEIVKL